MNRNQAPAGVQLPTCLPSQTMPIERNRGPRDQRVNHRCDIDGFDPMKTGELPGPRLVCKQCFLTAIQGPQGGDVWCRQRQRMSHVPEHRIGDIAERIQCRTRHADESQLQDRT